jgi:hypothetical protein
MLCKHGQWVSSAPCQSECLLRQVVVSLLTGGTAAQDIQTMWFSIRRVLEKIKAATCNHFQTSATLQAKHQGSF